MYDKEMIDMFM